MKKANKLVTLLLSLSLMTMGTITLTGCNFNDMGNSSSQSSTSTEILDTGSGDSSLKEETQEAPSPTSNPNNSVGSKTVGETDSYNVISQLFLQSSWSDYVAATTENQQLAITASAPKISASYIQALWESGYTHLTFEVEMTANNAATVLVYTNGGTWNRYWSQQDLDEYNTIRIDLNEFHDDDKFYSINFEPRNSAGTGVEETLTIMNVRAFKSAETLNWTKQNSNTYVAMEDGYIVMETHGNDGWVDTSADWFAPYLTKDDASQRTLSIYSEYLYKGNNTRTLIHGLNQQPINVVDNEGWSYFNNYTSAKEGDTLHLQLDKIGVVKIKLSPFVSNRNAWGTYKATVVSDTEVEFTADSDFKFRYALTQAYIDAGYTSVEVTFAGNFNGGEIWFGNDVWSGNTSYLQCKNAEGTYTVDLTKLAGEDLTFMLNGASVTDMTMSLVFTGYNGLPTKEYAIMVADNRLGTAEYEAATLLQEYLERMTNTYYEIVEDGSINSGAATHLISIGDTVLVDSMTLNRLEEVANDGYLLYAQGNTLYINGNMDRALLYGAYGVLRILGCEFYTKDVEYVPSNIGLDVLSTLDVVDNPDFAVRAYLGHENAYGTTEEELKFATAIGSNNESYIAANVKGVEYGWKGDPTHNALYYCDGYWGTEYCPSVTTGSSNVNPYAPCLTNGVTYNLDGNTTTLSIVTAQMKEIILANPTLEYFTFANSDGPTWYCACEYCVASNELYGASGTLVRFCNELLNNLKSDSELAVRDFKILTLAYSFTTAAPTNVTVHKDLTIRFCGYQDSKYALNHANQIAEIKTAFNAWISLTTGDDNGQLALWGYDTSFNNYLAYYSSTTINGALDGTLTALKNAGVEDVLVLGAYTADNNWQSAMKTYIWSRKLWDASLSTVDLQNAFIEAYFGPGAEYVKNYMAMYDGYYAAQEQGWYVMNGTGYYSNLTIQQHVNCLNIVLDAIAALESQGLGTDNIYMQRLYQVKVSSYASIIYNYSTYYNDISYRDELGASNIFTSESTAYETFRTWFKEACQIAGITIACENSAYNTIDLWLDNYVANNWA